MDDNKEEFEKIFTVATGDLPSFIEKIEAGKSYKIVIDSKILKADILEFEDVLFNLNSSVLLPVSPDGSKKDDNPDSTDEQEKFGGINTFFALFKYLNANEINKEKQMLIFGHADTSGEIDFNFTLSKLRALSVQYLLRGDTASRDAWGAQLKSDTFNGVTSWTKEDMKEIMTWSCHEFGWDCLPDGKQGRTYDWCVERFKIKYNNIFIPNASASEKLSLNTDNFKAKAWKAVFNLYQYALVKQLKPDEETMPTEEEFIDNGSTTSWMEEYRKNIHWLKGTPDESTIGCGESWPIADIGIDDYRSQANRRVEFLLFNPKEAEKLVLPCGDESCRTDICNRDAPNHSQCPIYAKGKLEKNYLPIDGSGNLTNQKDVSVQLLLGGFPYTNASCVIKTNQFDLPVTSDDKGMLTFKIDDVIADAQLVLDEDFFDITLHFDDLKDITENLGVNDRLHNLGYLSQPVVDEIDYNSQTALGNFQRVHKLELTWDINEETRDKLKIIHDDSTHDQLPNPELFHENDTSMFDHSFCIATSLSNSTFKGTINIPMFLVSV